MTYPGGSSTVYTYFPNSQDKRLQEIKYLTSTNALISRCDYTYDTEGQLLTWTKNYPGLATPQRHDLGYDNADQLLTAPLKNASTNALIKQYIYGYDLASNRTSERVANKTTTSTPNNVNEITSQSGGTIRTLTYDLNGSLINDGSTRTFEWDGVNRLVAVNYTGTTKRSEFSYDGLSRLVKIVEKSGTNINSTRKFVWCGMEKCEFRNANDGVTLRVYAQGQYANSTAYFYTRDHLGSVREMTDASGTVVARYDYDPFGRSTTVIGTNKPDFNFTGLYRHSPSNLDLAVRRAYDPDLGRWISRDPIGESGGLNLYGYVGNDPTNFVDPLGLDRIVGWYAGQPIILKDNPVPGQNPFADHYVDPITDLVKNSDVSVGFSASAGGMNLFGARISFGLTHCPTLKHKSLDAFDTDFGTGVSLDLSVGDRYGERINAIEGEIGKHLGLGIGFDESGNPTDLTLHLGIGIALTPFGYEMPVGGRKE